MTQSYARSRMNKLLNQIDAVLADPVQGAIIRGNSTPKFERYLLGAAGTFLGSDGTDLLYLSLPVVERLIVSSNTGSGYQYGTTNYIGFGAESTTEQSTTESEAQIRSPAGTAKKLRARAWGNALNGSTTITLRKNGVDTALTVTIAAGSTVWVTDDTHTVSVAEDDLLDWKVVTGGSSGNFLVGAIECYL